MPARSKMVAVYWSYEVSIGHRSPRCLAASRSRVRMRWPAGMSLRDVDIVVSFRLEAAVCGPRVTADRPTHPVSTSAPVEDLTPRRAPGRDAGRRRVGDGRWRPVRRPEPV